MKYSILLVLFTIISYACAAIDSDLVTDLPGLTFKPTFKHYSGYLKASGNKMLHYWFVESQNNPKADPVVLWLNGGPGCSSLDGMLSENGPFSVSDDGKSINENPYSWNKISNVLYLEAPAGVGFSYSSDKNYTTDDDQTSRDNQLALEYFMAHYPEFSKNPFYITGESYGGIYVPTLSNRIMADKAFNFKGFAVGNGLSDAAMNQDSLVYFAYYHGLFGESLWNPLLKNCCNDTAIKCPFSQSESLKCQELVSQAMASLNGLNIYNLYAECYQGNSGIRVESRYNPLNIYFPQTKERKNNLKKINSLPKEKVTEVPPCINADGLTTYLNTPAVRKSLHVADVVPTWAVCSDIVDYHRQYSTMRDQYLNVLSSKKYRILVYNGDVDMACNYLGDEWFVDSLGLKETFAYRSWSYKAPDGSNQVAGFVRQFENLDFVTIRGSGHMVPQDKPAAAFAMFNKYIGGK